MMAMPFNFTIKAIIKGNGPSKRPGSMRDGRHVMSLLVSIDGANYELNIVTKQGQAIEDAANELVKLGIVTKEKDDFVIHIPTWSLAKAKNNVIWVHIEDYERLKGTTT
jgi:hypothetical protein